MLMWSQMLVFCLTAGLLILTPGPNFIYVLTRGTTQGRRAAIVSTLGLGGGVMLHTLLICLGISTLIRSSYLAFQIIKYGGSLYLIYLGIKTILNRAERFDALPQVVRTDRALVWQSVLASMTNPKTILFFLSFLPQFVNHTSPVIPQLFLLGSLYMMLTVVIYGMVGYWAGNIGHWLRARVMIAARLKWVTGSSFIGLGVWAALSDRR